MKCENKVIVYDWWGNFEFLIWTMFLLLLFDAFSGVYLFTFIDKSFECWVNYILGCLIIHCCWIRPLPKKKKIYIYWYTSVGGEKKKNREIVSLVLLWKCYSLKVCLIELNKKNSLNVNRRTNTMNNLAVPN
jgi:hypothetical protein